MSVWPKPRDGTWRIPPEQGECGLCGAETLPGRYICEADAKRIDVQAAFLRRQAERQAEREQKRKRELRDWKRQRRTAV